jgi:hypothetical protein
MRRFKLWWYSMLRDWFFDRWLLFNKEEKYSDFAQDYLDLYNKYRRRVIDLE